MGHMLSPKWHLCFLRFSSYFSLWHLIFWKIAFISQGSNVLWYESDTRTENIGTYIFMVTTSTTALQTKREHTILEVHYNRHSQWKLLVCSLVCLSIHPTEYHLRLWQESKIIDTSALRYWYKSKLPMNTSKDNLLRMKSLLPLLQEVLKPVYQYKVQRNEKVSWVEIFPSQRTN